MRVQCGTRTTVFATNLRVGPDEAETFCRRYSRRWQIENEYKSSSAFLAKTSSKDYRVRLFYFVFAVLLYNIWRLIDFLLKAGVNDDNGLRNRVDGGRMRRARCLGVDPTRLTD